tara:strand:- start:1249 stop:1434 length:186 start_codon:yes stop_codon:yes gene_type:complete
MGILSVIQKKKDDGQLSASDLKFLLSKMRIATYTGEEFEQFYQIWLKLTKALEQLEDKKGA